MRQMVLEISHFKFSNRPIPNCINLTEYLLSKPLASFFSSKVFPKLVNAQHNGSVKIVNIYSNCHYLCLMHADEIITLGLTFKRKFGIGHFEQDGRHHFVGFQPHFHLNMTSRTQSCKAMNI